MKGLNPCCGGRCSSTAAKRAYKKAANSLNPCCGGRCSSTELYKTKLIINKLKNFTKQIFTFLNRKLTIS